MVVDGTSEPDVPVTVTVLVPVVAVEDAVKVKVDVALPFAGGVTGLVEKAAVTPPLGRPDALSVVAELNPVRLGAGVGLGAGEPCVTLTALGEGASGKPGVPGPTAKVKAWWSAEGPALDGGARPRDR